MKQSGTAGSASARRLPHSALLVLCGLSCMIFGAAVPAASAAQPAAKDKQQAAPQPRRLPDGKPNWTGFWSPVGGLLEQYRGPGGTAVPAGASVRSDGGPSTQKPPFAGFSPLKSPYKEQHAEYLAKAATGRVTDPVALCLPPGMPRMMVMVYGMELLQTPGQITITSEWQAASRRVWLNEKAHPDPEELDPTYAGHSIGRWEGDTLVIDTVGIRKDVPVDYLGLPQSGNMHVVERITETSPGILVNEITIDDPQVFTAPWKETITYRYRPDLRLQEYSCFENNRNVGADGETVFER
jgi:hypothetical protein